MYLKARVYFLNIKFVAIWFRFFLKFNPNDDCLALWDPINIIEFIIYRYIISDVCLDGIFLFDLQPHIGRL